MCPSNEECTGWGARQTEKNKHRVYAPTDGMHNKLIPWSGSRDLYLKFDILSITCEHIESLFANTLCLRMINLHRSGRGLGHVTFWKIWNSLYLWNCYLELVATNSSDQRLTVYFLCPKLCLVIELIETIKKGAIIFRSIDPTHTFS